MKKRCLRCKKEIIKRRGDTIAYFKQKKYCSNKCYWKHYHFKPHKSSFTKGHIPWNTGKKRPEISGENHYKWKGGKRKHSEGYILIYQPNHPFVQKDVKVIYEHRFIMEQHLGRYLKPYERIHHINGIRNDNRLENLKLLATSNKHALLHWEDPDYRKHMSLVHMKLKNGN